MNIEMESNIRSDFSGYNHLISIYHKIKEETEKGIILDFGKNTWFEANLAAVLGSICHSNEELGKTIEIQNVNITLENLLRRNFFLCKFGRDPLIIDSTRTVISYRDFTPYEDIEFMEYLSEELLSIPDFPKHSVMLGKKIKESIFEVFENARTHGNSKHIYTCGQYYPNKKKKRLDITIVDMGKTIKTNVNEYIKKDMSGSEAISWAMEYGNTTKTGNISGGLGLGIIFEFIQLNKGKIQIASSDGYWELVKGQVETKLFDFSFPGTIANIEFDLEDENTYRLKEEISLDDIF